MKEIFKEFAQAIFQLYNDLHFWQHFVSHCIDRYQKENPDNRRIFESGFYTWDVSLDPDKTRLGVLPDIFHDIEIDDLETHKKKFFIWVTNIAIVRAYNALEHALLRFVHHSYFPHLADPMSNRENLKNMTNAIADDLKANGKKMNTKNNRHLMDFISLKSVDAACFLSMRINENWTTTWLDFFDTFSILRQLVTHEGMIVSKDVKNSIFSRAKEIFEAYFNTSTDGDKQVLQPLNEESLGNFFNHAKVLAANIMKFSAGQPDLRFLGFSISPL